MEAGDPISIQLKPTQPVKKELMGIDIFLDWTGTERDPNVLGSQLEELAGAELQLKMITNRGVKVYPNGMPETFCTDHWRCRFVSTQYVDQAKNTSATRTAPVTYLQLVQLLNRLHLAGLNFIKTENLYDMNGKRAYSLGQGE